MFLLIFWLSAAHLNAPEIVGGFTSELGCERQATIIEYYDPHAQAMCQAEESSSYSLLQDHD